MSQYIISDEALQDLNDISDYFLQHNLEAGERFLQTFNLKCRQLVSFPKIGRSYEHLRPGLRGLPLRGLIVIDQVTDIDAGIKIEVLRVVNGRRDLKPLFTVD
jgi:toxin ParE1/3/4